MLAFLSIIPIGDAFKIHSNTCGSAWSYSYAFEADSQCPLIVFLVVDRVRGCKMTLKWTVCKNLEEFHWQFISIECPTIFAAAHLNRPFSSYWYMCRAHETAGVKPMVGAGGKGSIVLTNHSQSRHNFNEKMRSSVIFCLPKCPRNDKYDGRHS